MVIYNKFSLFNEKINENDYSLKKNERPLTIIPLNRYTVPNEGEPLINLLDEPEIDNAITEQGVRENINEGIEYLAFWQIGTGCCVVNYLMADAATCEVSRIQLWIWLKYKVKLDDGRIVDEKLIDELIKDELDKINKRFTSWKERTGDKSLDHVSFKSAAKIFKNMITDENFDEFLTLPLYEKI